MNHWTIILLSSLWLAGCAGPAKPITRYLLPGPEPSPALERVAEETLLSLRPLELAPYLAVEGIVLQPDPITLIAAHDHRWAAPLAYQLQRRLGQRLALRLPDIQILFDPEQLQRQPLILQLEVDHFQGRYDGLAVASGRWQLRGSDGQLLALQRFDVQSPLQSDGYPALVRALGESWDLVADQISAAIRRLR